jgi:plastocyanin
VLENEGRARYARGPIGGLIPHSRYLRRIGAATVLAAIAVTLAACSSGGSATSTTATSGASSGPTITASAGDEGGSTTSTIDIKNFAFSPKSITVAPGATVTVTNQDGVTHTLTLTKDGIGTGDIEPGQSKTFSAPNTAGSYSYFCSIHQYMTGMLTVS